MELTTSQLNAIQKKKIADGGEGIICDYSKDIVAKMYLPHVDKLLKERKVKAFIEVKRTAKIPDTVKLPLDYISVNSSFVGYIMGKVLNGEPIYYLTKTKQLAMLNFNNRDIVGVLIDLWETAEILHKNGIIMGDVSGYNFLLENKQVFFIDTESWGIINKFSPDAYTEMYTDPKVFNNKGGITHSFESDIYALCVLSFELLTRIHPFGGAYNPDKSMKIPDRAAKGLSILGGHDIKIPNNISSWDWMGPELVNAFKDVFENGKRTSIFALLKELYANMKYCKTHNTYYYNKFSDCPLCNTLASIKVAAPAPKAPVRVISNVNMLPLTILFENDNDVAIMLNENLYFSKDNHIVDITSGARKAFSASKRVRLGFFDSGKRYYIAEDGVIVLYNTVDDSQIGKIERYPASNFSFSGNCLYYVDISENLVKVEVTDHGNRRQTLMPSYHSIFDASDDGKVFLVSRYPDKIIIEANGFTHTIRYSNAINEYGIVYDSVTKQWLFIFKESNGGYRTMVFSDKIIYDSNMINYEASVLSNIDFYAGTIYEPVSGAIRGTNIAKNSVKDFACSVVDGDSKLRFTNNKFIITNAKKIYQFG